MKFIKIKDAFQNGSTLKANFIQSLIDFEIKSGYPEINIRDAITGPLIDELFMGDKFSKELANGIKLNFYFNSKISREFLLSQPKMPSHVWEPQTTKILLHFAKNAKNVIVAGAYFGDQAIPIAHSIKDYGVCHTFEPNKRNSDLIAENARINKLENVRVNSFALWNKSNEFLVFEGDDAIATTKVADKYSKNTLSTISIDDYVFQNISGEVNLLMIDVEGSEMKVLQGAKQTLEKYKPIIVFETHSLYNDWSNGLENSNSVKLVRELGYFVFAVREFHQNIDTGEMPVELLPLERTFCEIPPDHGFNLLAVPSEELIKNKLFRVVYDLSPKLLLHKNDLKFLPSTF